MKDLVRVIAAFLGLSLAGENSWAGMCEGQFVPNDLTSSASISIQDIEFDPVNKRMVFKSGGRIIVANLDQVSGNFVSSQVLDTGAVGNVPGIPFGSGGGNGNGPEWAFGLERGYEIYYTKLDSSGHAYIASLYQGLDATNPWQKRIVPGTTNKGIPVASFNLTDVFPAIGYLGGDALKPLALWREDSGDNYVESVNPYVDLTSVTGGNPARFLPGKRETLISRQVDDGFGNRISQLARMDSLAQELDIIATYAPGSVINSVNALRLGEDVYVFYGIIDNQYIDVFLSTGWYHNTRTGRVRPPVADNYLNKYVLDEEGFVGRDGMPYITIIMDSDKENLRGSSEVWVASAFAKRPCEYRKISTTSKFATVADPEPLTVESGTYVYYGQLINGAWRLHKAATGL